MHKMHTPSIPALLVTGIAILVAGCTASSAVTRAKEAEPPAVSFCEAATQTGITSPRTSTHVIFIPIDVRAQRERQSQFDQDPEGRWGDAVFTARVEISLRFPNTRSYESSNPVEHADRVVIVHPISGELLGVLDEAVSVLETDRVHVEIETAVYATIIGRAPGCRYRVYLTKLPSMRPVNRTIWTVTQIEWWPEPD